MALRFLSNIYMSSEHQETEHHGGSSKTPSVAGSATKEAILISPLPSVEDFIREQDGTGPQLEQTNAIRIGGKKYQYTRRPALGAMDQPNASKRHEARLKQWRKDALSSGLHRGRLFLSAQSSYPVLCFSVLNYDASTEKEAKRKRNALRLEAEKGRAEMITVGKRGKQGVSYVDLFGGPMDLTKRLINSGGATTGAGTKAGGTNSGRQKIRSKYGGGTNGTGLILSDENNMDMENVPATAAADALGQVEARSKDAASLINVQQQVSEEENEDEDIEAMLDNAKEDPGEGGVHRADHHGDHHGDHRGDRRHAIGSVENYDPNFLDDGTIKQGKSRLITSGPSHRHSFLPYVKRSNLKDEINAQFRELHPWLPTSMSLSKIRTLKRESLEQWKKNDLELSTLALGIVYFERLVIKTLVMKTNRKLKFAACLFIAFKFNVGELRRDFMTTDDEIIESSDLGVTSPAAMQRVLESIEKSLLISRKDLFKIELQVFAELDFNLSIPPEKLMPHFMRLLDTLDLTPREYLGGKRMRMLWDDEDEDDEPENIIENLLSEKHLSKVGGGGGGGGISSSAEDPAAVYSDLSDAITL